MKYFYILKYCAIMFLFFVSSHILLLLFIHFFSPTDEKFDLIVIDPPWVNRSVKRKSRYFGNFVDFPFLFSLSPLCVTEKDCV